MARLIHSKTYYTPTGRKRIVEVQEHSYGGYQVVKYNVPKNKSKLTWGTWVGNFTDRSKAIKKANSLARRK